MTKDILYFQQNTTFGLTERYICTLARELDRSRFKVHVMYPDVPQIQEFALLGELDVANLSDKSRSALRGRWFGFIFQNYNLLPRLSALEQVELPLLYNKVSNRRRRASEALDQLGLADRLHHRPNQMSGGQQQRVAIARSLVVNPQVILADEPTGALDTRTGIEIMSLFQKLNATGITITIVTHEADVAQFANRIIRFQDGRIISEENNKESVNAEELLQNFKPVDRAG